MKKRTRVVAPMSVSFFDFNDRIVELCESFTFVIFSWDTL